MRASWEPVRPPRIRLRSRDEGGAGPDAPSAEDGEEATSGLVREANENDGSRGIHDAKTCKRGASDLSEDHRESTPFECAISLETLAQPVTLSCGHNFSLRPLLDWTRAKGDRAACPTCRATIGRRHLVKLASDTPPVNKVLETAISRAKTAEREAAQARAKLTEAGNQADAKKMKMDAICRSLFLGPGLM